jgi:hypothetical protein
MSDSYQAIYNAVRSSISGGNVGEIVAQAAREAFDISHYAVRLHEQFLCAAYEMQRPSAVYRPSISMDGTKWCALYGEDLQNGVAGFGDTPAEAMAEFDKAWGTQRTSAAIRTALTKAESA